MKHQFWNNDEARKYIYNPLEISEKIDEYTFPSEILVYEPTKDDIFTRFHTGSQHEFKVRQIFLQVELLEDEEMILVEFDNYLNKKNIIVPEFMKPLLLRVLTFNKRRYPNNYLSKSMNHLISMFQWRISTYPLNDLEQDLRHDLDSGIIYWHGRDYSLRPILIIRLSRINKNFPVERFIRLIVFCMEWGMRYLMFPGKVETCLALIDIRGVSLTSFPLSTMNEISSLLTNQYSFRLYRMFILHDSLFIQTVWSLMKQFLTDLQQHKIVLSRNDIRSQLFKTVHPNQVEEYFGGLQMNRTKPFYPFKFPKGPFADPEIHPSNGFTRFIIENKDHIPNFNDINNCHLLINGSNVLGELFYNGKKHCNIKWDDDGLSKIKDLVQNVLKIDLNNNNQEQFSNLTNIDNNSLNKLDFHFKVHEADEIQEVEKLESKSYVPNNPVTQNISFPPYSTEITEKSTFSENHSRDINIGIINTININSDIANIGDRSQHFIREYSVKPDSPITNHFSQMLEDTQSFFSASSNNYINEELGNSHFEDFRNNLIIDNQCYDHGVFQSFGVLPISRNVRYSKIREEKKNECNPSIFSSISLIINNISPVSNSTKSTTSEYNKNTNGNNPQLNGNDNSTNNSTQITKKANERNSLSLSPLIDADLPVSSLNTSCSRSISVENTNIQETLKLIRKETTKISKKSRFKSKVYRMFGKLRNSKSSIDENSSKI